MRREQATRLRVSLIRIRARQLQAGVQTRGFTRAPGGASRRPLPAAMADSFDISLRGFVPGGGVQIPDQGPVSPVS